MNQASENGVEKAVDRIQQRLTDYGCELKYENLTPEAIHAAKASVIDTLGALVCGFFGEPCQITRDIAATMPQSGGVAVIGTRLKCAPDMAAFVNATTARYAEMTDIYHLPGSAVAHPSDALTPVLAAAEHVHACGREFILAIVRLFLPTKAVCRWLTTSRTTALTIPIWVASALPWERVKCWHCRAANSRTAYRWRRYLTMC